jgi:transcriptional regulator with XRE-family HTH domain
MPTLTPLAMKIRKLRTARGLKQVEVAAALDLSRGSYAMIETGADTPGREAMIRIADFFGVSLDWLEDRLHKVTAPDAGQVVKDLGEIGLLHFWRGLSADQKLLMTRMLGNLSPGAINAA